MICQTFNQIYLVGGKDLSELKAQTLFESLTVIKDPRVERTRLHSLRDILVIAICAMICGAEDWAAMEEFGEAKQE